MIENEEIIKMSADLIDVYTKIEDDLIMNVAKRFSVADEVSPETVLKWQADKLDQLGALRSENIKTISKYSKKSITEIKKIMTDAGYTAVEADEALYDQAFSEGLFKSVPIPTKVSPALKAILKGAIDNTRKMFNMINTTALESANTQFLKIINQSYLEVSTGLYDYNTAIRKAVRNLADEGITGANYVSAAGRATKNHIDVAVRRAILTSTSQTAGTMQLQRAQAWGNNHVEVSSHAGSRPSHAVWQGKVFMLNGSDAKYENFYTATEYGSVTGLCGANCAHKFFPFIEGISEQTYHPYDLEENKKQYEASQKQRQLERDVRQQKRRILTADQIGDKEAKTAAQLKLKAKESQLKAFTGKTGRTQRTNRQQVMDFGHSQASQAVWTNKKHLDNLGNSGILKSSDITIGKDLGAAAFRDKVWVEGKGFYKLTQGSKITKVVVFAGKGTTKPVRVAEHLSERYGGKIENWQHTRGEGHVDFKGKSRKAELHWFENEDVGRVKMKVKRWFDGS